MPSLYRCRGSTEELRTLFSCEPEQGLKWRALVRPRQSALVVRREGSRRVAEIMQWGIPAPQASERRYSWTELDPFSDLAFGKRVERPRRCLIVLDSFALPDGPKLQRTRSWFGLWDEPLFAWAGLWREIETVGRCYLGAVTDANALVKRVGRVMPVILKRDEYELWLYGSVRDVLPLWRRSYDAGSMWLEQTDELWSKGTSLQELEAERAFGSAVDHTSRSPAR